MPPVTTVAEQSFVTSSGRNYGLARSGGPLDIPSMATPIFDFSHLSPAERIELAEQLWDSLEPDAVPVSAEQAAELRRRRMLLAESPGRPWQEALDELEQHGG